MILSWRPLERKPVMESGEKKARKDRNSLLLELRMTKHKEQPQVKE